MHPMNHSTHSLDHKDSLTLGDWRETFLQRILVITAAIGTIAVLLGILTTENLVLQGIYISVYVILVVTLVIRMPYTIKAIVFVTLPFILGISSMVNAGIRGDSLFFFLAFVTFSALLIGTRSGLIAISLSESVIVVMGFLILNDHFSLLDPLSDTGNLENWMTDGVVHFLVSLVIMEGIRMLQGGYDHAQSQNKAIVDLLRESQLELEDRVAERTKELKRKTEQLNASTIVTHQVADIQELVSLLTNAVDLIAKHFNLYHAGIYLINERGDYAVLQAASSEGGKRLLEKGYRLGVGTQGNIGFVAADKNPRIARDEKEDIIFIKNNELPDTRSELSLPLIVRNRVIGVLDLQSSEEQAFQHEDIEVFQALADQIAVTIENARLLSESQLVISQLEIASGIEVRQNWQSKSITNKPAYHYSATGLRPLRQAQLPGGKNSLEIPLMLRGQKIGKISLHRKDDFQYWTTQEEIVANEVATQTALALENIRLVEHTRERAEREQSIAGIANRIRESLDLDMVLRTSVREIQTALNLQEAEIRLVPQGKLGNIKKPLENTPE